MNEIPELPLDYKIELDRLILNLMPTATEIADIIKNLPKNSDKVIINGDGFDILIKLKEW